MKGDDSMERKGAGLSMIVYQGHELDQDLLLSRLIAKWDETERKRILEEIGKISIGLAHKEPELLQYFEPKVEYVLQKGWNMAILLVNLGMVLVKKERNLSEPLIAQILKKEGVVTKFFYPKGRTYFLEEREKQAQPLLKENIFEVELQSGKAICSLFTREEEKLLKHCFAYPPQDEFEIEKRKNFYHTMLNWIRVAMALGIRRLYSGYMVQPSNGEDRKHYFSPEFFSYQRNISSRNSDEFVIIKGGILKPTLKSLFIRLMVAVIENDHTVASKFFRLKEYETSAGTKRQKLVFETVDYIRIYKEIIGIDEERDPEQTRVMLESLREEAMTFYLQHLAEMFSIDHKMCQRFVETYVSEQEKISQSLPYVLEMVKAILEDEFCNSREILEKYPAQLEFLQDELESILQLLAEDAKRYVQQTDPEMVIEIEALEEYWKKILVLRPKEEKSRQISKDVLLSGDRVLSVEKICQLKNFEAILSAIGNFSTWPEQEQNQLVQKFSWNYFIEQDSTGEQIYALSKIIRPKINNEKIFLNVEESGRNLPTVTKAVNHWPQIVGKLNWEKKEVLADVPVYLWELAWKDGDEEMLELAKKAAREVYFSRERFLRLPLVNLSYRNIPSIKWKERFEAVFILFQRMEERTPLSRMTTSPTERLLTATCYSPLFFEVVGAVSIRAAALWFDNKVVQPELCPDDSITFEKWPKILWELELLQRKRPYTYQSKIDGMRCSERVQVLYSLTKIRSKKHADMVRNHWKKYDV